MTGKPVLHKFKRCYIATTLVLKCNRSQVERENVTKKLFFAKIVISCHKTFRAGSIASTLIFKCSTSGNVYLTQYAFACCLCVSAGLGGV